MKQLKPGILLVPWIVIGIVLVIANAEVRSGTDQPVWREQPGVGTPILPNNYSPLPSLSGLIKNLKPAVVNIYTTQVHRHPAARRMPRFQDPFFDEFFGGMNPFEQFGMPRGEMKQNALGSGFIISPDGYVITNAHVVAKASEILVKTADKQSFKAKVIGSDEKTDIALLKVDPKGSLPFTYLGDSDKLEEGDWVIAIGNPFGLGTTVTAGIISGKDRQIGHGPYDDFLQTDASINPGNSGGPLFDSAGNVVGINTAIIGGASGISFAVPINLAKSLLPQLKTAGKITRGWLGVGIQDLNDELAESFEMQGKSGVLVSQVFEGGPADRAGLKAGDIIVTLNGAAIGESRQLTSRVAQLLPGAKAQVEVLREGKTRSFTVALGERDKEEAVALGQPEEGGREISLGLVLSPVTAEKARKLGIDEKLRGLVVEEIDRESAAAGIIQAGDVVLEVNRQRVASLSDFQRAVSRSGKKGKILMRIQRGPSQLFIVIQS